MKHWMCLVVFWAFFSSNSASVNAQPTLPTVEVTASTSDGGSVMIPFFFQSSARLSPYLRLGSDGPALDMTKDQYCAQLSAVKPDGCSVGTFPAAPGIPSASGAAWSGNGCGAAPWSTALASGYLTVMLPGVYSGDINRPVKDNPSIDFTSYCNRHDQDYTSRVYKATADDNFRVRLSNFCSSSTNQSLCDGFASTYVQAVQKYGDGAYQDDQAQLICASWGYAMKQSGCKG